ncbi:MAG: M23 family metallopeptidase [Aggregatilineales bacterium]
MSRQWGIAPLLLVVVLVGFGALLWANAAPTPALRPVIPTDLVPTEDPNSWQNILRAGFGSNSTPLPTVAIPAEQFIPPTLPRSGDTNVVPIEPGALVDAALPTFAPLGPVTPTPPPPTAVSLAFNAPITVQAVTRPPSVWRPPPLIPPVSRDPLGRDHYWFQRPVDSNANNAALFYYPYGSDGPERDNPWRIHNGIDMPNPVGETVRAAGSGRVVWAAGGVFQNSPSYGNVVAIEHDFGYRGQPLYTIYAHLSAVLVANGQQVNAGDVIGLVGQTGRVSGPHVHFEVRMGENHYRATYNPLLWMVPYVGHGVIAGRVTNAAGKMLMDHEITVRRWATGLVQDTTTSYIYQYNGLDVNADPEWNENFVVGDVPAGRYEVIANIDSERVVQIVDVVEGTTVFVELQPRRAEPAAPPS